MTEEEKADRAAKRAERRAQKEAFKKMTCQEKETFKEELKAKR